MTRTDTGSHPQRAPIPPGWPGDDPTVPEEVATLGRGRRGRAPAPARADPAVQGDDAGVDDVRVDDVPTEIDPPDEAAPQEDARHGLDSEVVELDDELDDFDDFDDDLIAGVQPAGRVLVVMILALVLAMLVNADALVERAEGQAPGPGRDRSLAVWHAVQDVSHALQLHRVRDVAEGIAGDDEDSAADSSDASAGSRGSDRPAADEASPTTDDTTTDAATDDAAGAERGGGGTGSASAGAVEPVRTPTADDPLRVWIGGDSMAELFGRALADQAAATGLVEPTLHYEMASGLTRPDYFDWPSALEADLDEVDPEVVVAVFGVNDAQGIVLPDGTPVPEVADPRWTEEYRRRVGEVMDQLRADGRLVVWMTQPPMREPGYGGRIATVNQAVVAEAATRPWVVVVDPARVVGDASGAYAQALPDAAGAPVEVRRPDGIHLTTAGGERLAAHVLAVIGQHVDLSGGDS